MNIQAEIDGSYDPSCPAFNTTENEEVMRWTGEGRIFWKGREVETDEELREMVRDMHGWMMQNFTGMQNEQHNTPAPR